MLGETPLVEETIVQCVAPVLRAIGPLEACKPPLAPTGRCLPKLSFSSLGDRVEPAEVWSACGRCTSKIVFIRIHHLRIFQ